MTKNNISDVTQKAEKEEVRKTLTMMKNQLKRYKYYKPFSFLNGQERTTEDLMKTVTATGLLQDMATLTADLNAEQKKKKEYTKEVFCAYCMNICASIVENWRCESGEDKAAKVLDLLFRFRSRRDNDEKVTEVADDWTNQPGLINELTNWLKKNGGSNFHREIRKRASARSKDIWRLSQIERKVKDPVTGRNKKVYTPKMQLEQIETQDPVTGEYYINSELAELIAERANQAMQTESIVIMVQDALLKCYVKQTISSMQHDIICYKFGIGNDYGDGMTLKEIAEELNKDQQFIRRQYEKACTVLGKFLVDNKSLYGVL